MPLPDDAVQDVFFIFKMLIYDGCRVLNGIGNAAYRHGIPVFISRNQPCRVQNALARFGFLADSTFSCTHSSNLFQKT